MSGYWRDPGRWSRAQIARARSEARISRLKGWDLTWQDAPETLFDTLDAATAWRLRACDLVSMVGITDMPGRSSTGELLSRLSAIFTGMRCTTLVKLPVALSGGSNANSWPLAGAMLSTLTGTTDINWVPACTNWPVRKLRLPTTPSIGATIEVYSRLSWAWLCTASA